MTYTSLARPAMAPALTVVFLTAGLLVSTPPAHADVERREIPYSVEFTGEFPSDIRSLIKRVSSLQSGVRSPPVSDVGLRRRVRGDLERIGAALRSEGYYAAILTEHIDLTVVPATVRIEVSLGELYVVTEIVFRLADERPTPHAVALLRSLPRPDEQTPARSAVVGRLAEEALGSFVDQGYLAATLGEREFRVDHATRTLRGDIALIAGTRARFGPSHFEGLIDVREDYASSLIDWREGDYLVRARVDATTKGLMATRLFASVRIDRSPPAAGQDSSPVTIVVSERPFRSIGFGIAYDSIDGVGANVFWEHRNLGGAGRRLRLGLRGGLSDAGGSASYRQPNFLMPTQAFLADLDVFTEDTKAYDADLVTTAVGLERLLAIGTIGRVGLAFDTGNVEAKAEEDGTDGRENLTFVSLPMILRYDGSDNLLKPTRGTRLDFLTTPYLELFGGKASFSKNALTLRGYRTLDGDRRWVAALRGKVGTILGASRSEIPVNKRFFSGGGGSVRGYEYQLAGPLSADREESDKLRPVGGRSLLEAGGELRLRIGKSMGLVGFVDGGSVYESPVPDLEATFYVGAGLGVRYYSLVGPIRIDVATPVNGRDEDDTVQVYVSIGESY
jgi:translocation and assembly module TamA